MKKHIFFVLGLVTLIHLVAIPILFANEQSYSGKIVALDPKLRMFIVKGEDGEKTFHPTRDSKFTIDGQTKLFGELQKGEEVTVHYNTTNNTHIATRVTRLKPKPEAKELQFQGEITAIGESGRTLTVKSTVKGRVEEKTFHVNPRTQIYVGGEEKFFDQLQKGERVTVTYERKVENQVPVNVARNVAKS